MFDTKILGSRLTQLRGIKGVTRQELASLLQVTKTQICDLENGKTGTNLTRLVTLAEFYHVSTDYLLGVTDDPAWRGGSEGERDEAGTEEK